MRFKYRYLHTSRLQYPSKHNDHEAFPLTTYTLLLPFPDLFTTIKFIRILLKYIVFGLEPIDIRSMVPLWLLSAARMYFRINPHKTQARKRNHNHLIQYHWLALTLPTLQLLSTTAVIPVVRSESSHQHIYNLSSHAPLKAQSSPFSARAHPLYSSHLFPNSKLIKKILLQTT